MRWLPSLLIVALLGAGAFLVAETREVASLAGSLEGRAVRAERALAAAQAALADAADSQAAPPERPAVEAETAPSPTDAAVALEEYSRLQLELHTTREQLQALRALLAERNAELERRAAASRERAAASLRPMPLGVRECLQALHECLRAEGFTSQRFLRATAVDADGLRDVELLEAASDGLGVTFLTAERMTASLDRSTGRLELRFFEGRRSVEGERAALPDDGFAVVFDDVDGRRFEARLPYLVRAEGAYPVDPAPPEREPGALDPAGRRSWAARLTRLLESAGTELGWSATRVRGLLDGRFLHVDLVGTNDKDLVLGSAHGGRVAVEVDERRDVVSLLLQDGVLRRDGVESTIGAEGFRMLLPGVTPKRARDAMLGMVIAR
ncbi:MAG: hypothetical protein ACON4Z_07460 [Planctomycetota bacterium]